MAVKKLQGGKGLEYIIAHLEVGQLFEKACHLRVKLTSVTEDTVIFNCLNPKGEETIEVKSMSKRTFAQLVKLKNFEPTELPHYISHDVISREFGRFLLR